MTNFTCNLNSTPHAGETRLLWLVILVLGGVFFFVFHDLSVSRFEQFAPWSDTDEIKAAGGNVVKGAALSLLGLLGVYFLWQKEGRKLQLGGPLAALMFFYVAWAALSITWSIEPWLTTRHVAVLCFCFLGALGIARQLSERNLAVAALVITSVYLVMGVAAELALGTFRPWAGEYRFSGTLHPNAQGLHISILCLAAFLLARTSPSKVQRNWLTALFAAAFVFLLLTKSRTALAGFLPAITVLWFVRTSASKKALIIVGLLFTVCMALLICSLVDINSKDLLADTVMLGRQEEIQSLTGRLPIWSELMHYIGQRPLAGYGYETFWTPAHIEDLSTTLQWRFREAHSGYLDAVLSTGLVGASCLLLIVIIGIVSAAVKYRDTNRLGCAMTLGLLLIGLISAFLESGMVGENFATLLTGCCMIQLACLPPEDDLQTVIRSKQEIITAYYPNDINPNPGIATPELR